MADIGFNLLMSRIMVNIEEKLGELPLYAEGQKSLTTDVPPISLVDDLAIPIVSASLHKLLMLLGQVTSTMASSGPMASP